MKRKLASGLAVLLISCSSTFAQNSEPAAPPDNEAIQLAHDILVATHADSNILQAIDAMTPVMVEALKRDKADIPDNVVQKFTEIFRGEMQDGIPEVLNLEAQVYARHYSVDELRELAKFYQSDIGKKVIAETPGILKETIPLGQAWGRATGQRAAIDTIDKLRKQGLKI